MDPVSYLITGLHQRFAPLDDEARIRATHKLLSFGRRSGQHIDNLILRFEMVRRPAPRFAEHNSYVFRDLLRLSDEEIAQLEADEVIADTPVTGPVIRVTS